MYIFVLSKKNMKDMKGIKEIKDYLRYLTWQDEDLYDEFIDYLIKSTRHDEDCGLTFNQWLYIKWICGKYNLL